MTVLVLGGIEVEGIDFVKNNAQLKHLTPIAVLVWVPALEAYKAASDHLKHRDGWGYAFASRSMTTLRRQLVPVCSSTALPTLQRRYSISEITG